MRLNSNSQSDFILNDGTLLDVKIEEDENGTPVISSIHLFYPKGKKVPQGGISASTLRELKFEELLVAHFKKEFDRKPSPYEEAMILRYLKNVFLPSGRTAYPREYYAALSYLYIEQFRKTPGDPTNQLAELLNVPKRTLVNRLARARKLGLLTQNSPKGPSGRAGGSLTREGLEAIKNIRSSRP